MGVVDAAVVKGGAIVHNSYDLVRSTVRRSKSDVIFSICVLLLLTISVVIKVRKKSTGSFEQQWRTEK